MKVAEILQIKGNILFTVTPETPIIEAINVMAKKDIGSLVVVEFEKLVGILTFREILKTVLKNKGIIKHSTVGEHMDYAPIVVTSDTDLNEVRRLMLEKHARYVPVINTKTVLGVMSFYDVAKAMLDAQGLENRMLKAYIHDVAY